VAGHFSEEPLFSPIESARIDFLVRHLCIAVLWMVAHLPDCEIGATTVFSAVTLFDRLLLTNDIDRSN
jgi:hypothetical protein